MGRQPASKRRQNSASIPGAKGLQGSWPCAFLSNTINLLGPVSIGELRLIFVSSVSYLIAVFQPGDVPAKVYIEGAGIVPGASLCY